MSRASTYQHEFVKSFPDKLQEGTLYVSVEFGTTAHRCFCGCGQEVYTRLSPRDWMMVYDGETVWLDPSVGNWSFPCQSHYWLTRGNISWAPQWSREQIEEGRSLDRLRRARYHDPPDRGPEPAVKRGWRKALARIQGMLFRR